MKKFLKKTLAMFLALVMCVGMMAVPAFAAETVTISPGTKTDTVEEGTDCHYTEKGTWNPGHIKDQPHRVYYEVTTPQTCEQDGLYQKHCNNNSSCSVNQETYTAKAKGHSYVYTSNRDGTHNVTCSNGTDDYGFVYTCGYEVLNQACTFENGNCKLCNYQCPHPEARRTNYTPVANSGNHTYLCSVCNETVTEAHTPSQWVTSPDAKCTDEKITQTANCTKCNAAMTQEIVGTGSHVLEKTDAADATCTEDGNAEYWTCSVCHKLFSDALGTTETTAEAVKITSNGHTLTKTGAVAATCTEAGNPDYWECSVCQKYFTEENTSATNGKDTAPVTNALGHKPSSGWKKSGAAHWHFCTNSGCTEKLDSAPHSYGDWSLAEGVYSRTCSVCGYVQTSETMPDHTCTFDGAWIPTSDGTHAKQCTFPGCTNLDTPVAHSEGVVTEGREAVAATCLHGGKTAQLTCPDCNAVIQAQTDTPTDPTNHDAECTVTVTNRGTTVGHVGVRSCGVEEGPVVPHTWGGWVTSSDFRVRTCTACGATQRQTFSSSGGATITDPVTPDDTNNDDGLTDIEDEAAPLAGLPFDLDPTEELTRGLFAQILYWYEDEPETDAEAPFTDVEGHEYAQAITWGAVNGILLGYEDNTYRPDNAITRGEMERILNRYALYKESKLVVELSGEGADVMLWAEAEEIIDNFFSALAIEAE